MIAQLISGTVGGLVSPFTQAYTANQQIKAQKEFQKQQLEFQKQQAASQTKLVKQIAIGLAIVVIIYVAIKD